MRQFKAIGLAGASGLAVLCGAASASAQSEPILGQVALFATDWCPEYWAPANGALIPISQNSALYSLYGVTYGGDGQVTFGLPNLSNRAPINWSSANPLGAQIGQSSVTMTQGQMPMHTHVVLGSSAATATNDPTGASLGTFPAGQAIYAPNSSTPDVPMHAGIVGIAGGSQPIPTQSPALAMTWCVAVQGIYPSRP